MVYRAEIIAIKWAEEKSQWNQDVHILMIHWDFSVLMTLTLKGRKYDKKNEKFISLH